MTETDYEFLDRLDAVGLREKREKEGVETHIGLMVNDCHARAVKAGWFLDPQTGESIERNVGEMLALIHSEVSEALEGYRRSLHDKHLPARLSIEVELADVIIRVFDLAGYLKLDLGGAFVEKLDYNQIRADHRLDARKNGGKKF